LEAEELNQDLKLLNIKICFRTSLGQHFRLSFMVLHSTNYSYFSEKMESNIHSCFL